MFFCGSNGVGGRVPAFLLPGDHHVGADVSGVNTTQLACCGFSNNAVLPSQNRCELT